MSDFCEKHGYFIELGGCPECHVPTAAPRDEAREPIYVRFSHNDDDSTVVLAMRGVNGDVFCRVQCDHILSHAEEVRWNTFIRDCARIVDGVAAPRAPRREPT